MATKPIITGHNSPMSWENLSLDFNFSKILRVKNWFVTPTTVTKQRIISHMVHPYFQMNTFSTWFTVKINMWNANVILFVYPCLKNILLQESKWLAYKIFFQRFLKLIILFHIQTVLFLVSIRMTIAKKEM